MVRVRMWAEQVSAIASAFLAALTVVVPGWLEEVFGFDPDAGSGAAEWLITAGFVAGAGVLWLLAHRDRRLLTLVSTRP